MRNVRTRIKSIEKQLAQQSETNGAYLYIVKGADAIKIGVACNVNRRIAQLQTGNPNSLELMGLIYFPNRKMAFAKEKQLHDYFQNAKRKGEWFDAELVMQTISSLF